MLLIVCYVTIQHPHSSIQDVKRCKEILYSFQEINFSMHIEMLDMGFVDFENWSREQKHQPAVNVYQEAKHCD